MKPKLRPQDVGHVRYIYPLLRKASGKERYQPKREAMWLTKWKNHRDRVVPVHWSSHHNTMCPGCWTWTLWMQCLPSWLSVLLWSNPCLPKYKEPRDHGLNPLKSWVKINNTSLKLFTLDYWSQWCKSNKETNMSFVEMNWYMKCSISRIWNTYLVIKGSEITSHRTHGKSLDKCY
jgi:hypothetical protein